MTHPPRVYRPVVVDVPPGPHAGTYELHLGHPGEPRVYRRLGMQGLRRIKDPAAIDAVARAYGVARAAARREIARRKRWPYRWLNAVGRWVARAWVAVRRWLGRVRWVRTGVLP